MTDEKQKTRKSPLSKWVVLPIVSVLAAAALIPLLLWGPLAQKGPSEEGNAEVQERVPAVHSAQDAIDVLSGISMDLGYENALAEQFMTGIPDDITWTSDRFEYEVICNLSYDYHYAKDRGVCYNNNGILSYVMDWNVSLCYYKNGQSPIGREWYQGQHCIVYDLETGQHLTLAQITGMDDQTLLRMLKDAYGRIYNYYYFSMLNIDYDPTTFSLENPRFLVDREGQIILLFSCTEAYDPAILEVYPRMAHIYDLQLPTGLYLLGS